MHSGKRLALISWITSRPYWSVSFTVSMSFLMSLFWIKMYEVSNCFLNWKRQLTRYMLWPFCWGNANRWIHRSLTKMMRVGSECYRPGIWPLEVGNDCIPCAIRRVHPIQRIPCSHSPHKIPVTISVIYYYISWKLDKFHQILAVTLRCSIISTRARYMNPSLYRAKT